MRITDFDLNGINLLYSSAELFTWKKFDDHRVLVLYGGLNELHEFAVQGSVKNSSLVEGDHVDMEQRGSYVVVRFQTVPRRRVILIDTLRVVLLDRASAFQYWVPDLPGTGTQYPPAYGSSLTNSESLIVKGPYLVRSAAIHGDVVDIRADFTSNTTTDLEVIGVGNLAKKLVVNGRAVPFQKTTWGSWKATSLSEFSPRKPCLPKLESLNWHKIDTLPEVQPGYDDAAWPEANKTATANTRHPLDTAVSLYGADYGFHTGALIFRGTFVAQGGETFLNITTEGGPAHASSAWLDGRFIGSHTGIFEADRHTNQWQFPGALDPGSTHNLTVVIDNHGYDANVWIGDDKMKNPRGIIDYHLGAPDAQTQPRIDWRLTGNLGGENYSDRERGPLNEGGFFVERQGYHPPKPPIQKFVPGSPFDGLDGPGIAFFTAELTLNLPPDWDIPLSFKYGDISDGPRQYRSLLFVNGWQFGRYISHLGPQTVFPVPQGILDHRGVNTIGILIWALGNEGASPKISFEGSSPIVSGWKPVALVDSPSWEERKGTY